MYLKSFNYFRGIAILMIAAGHCWGYSGWIPESTFGRFIIHFIVGGTSLFVFISGFLFHHIYYNQFAYKEFMIKKIKTVLCPYLLLSMIPVFYIIFVNKTGPFPEYFFLPEEGIYAEYIRPLILYLLTGRTFWGYWYIPFIMVIFLLSPFFVRYIEWPYRIRIMIMLLLFCVSTVMGRPKDNIFVFQSVVYFAPVYLLGITASMHKEKMYNIFQGKELYLLFIVFSVELFHLGLYYDFQKITFEPFAPAVIDIMIMEKSILCLFFMVWLHRFEDGKIPYLDKMAGFSFPIYFIHPIVLASMKHLLKFSERHQYNIMTSIFGFLYHPMGLLLYFPMVLFASIAVAIMIKKVLRSNSRFVVGF